MDRSAASGKRRASGPGPSRGPPKKQKVEAAASKSKGVDLSVEPMSSIEDCVFDLTTRSMGHGLRAVINALAGRPLRVATMCSGTESPVLALKMIFDVLSTMGHDLRLEHLFSAEIVPFKQAFIERNFQPSIIYRDITELYRGYGTTVYGATKDLPAEGKVDLLVAGFACVDFSNLNANKKKLEVATSEEEREELANKFLEGEVHPGESSATLQAIIFYAMKYRPPLIILENVNSAPWDAIIAHFEAVHYSVGKAVVDTKQYYIPQTRQRVYLICILQAGKGWSGGMEPSKAKSATLSWVNVLRELKRPASSPVEEFLLKDGDPELVRGIESMLRDQAVAQELKRDVSWNVCFGRHLRYRDENGYGTKTPYTNWQSRKMLFPDYSEREWIIRQPERVKDCLDLLILQNAATESKDYDFEFKSRFPDVSQNIDRNLDSDQFGIIGCLTPNGMPFFSFRGAPVLGLEALTLQGLNPRRLLLTKESQSELRDLAGNAMTLTVVGAAILAALIVGHEAVSKDVEAQPRLDQMAIDSLSQSVDQVATIDSSIQSVDHMEIDPSLQNVEQPVGFTKVPKRQEQVDFGTVFQYGSIEILNLAEETARKCYCETQYKAGRAQILRCSECGHMACKECAGNPRHVYREVLYSTRAHPREFMDRICKLLPTRLKLDGFEELQELVDDIHRARAHGQLITVDHLDAEEFRFKTVRHLACWEVMYESPNMSLKLSFQSARAVWSLFLNPNPRLPGNDQFRITFRRPVAEMTAAPDCNFLAGAWILMKPVETRMTVSICAAGHMVQSWKSELGLDRYKDERVSSRYRLSFSEQHKDDRLSMLAGTYELLPFCGTASRCLYKKLWDDDCTARTDLYLFLDPERNQPSSLDEFVISSTKERLSIGECRPVLARIGDVTNFTGMPQQKKWRPSSNEEDYAQLLVDYDAVSCKGSLSVWTDEVTSISVLDAPLEKALLNIGNQENCYEAFVVIFSGQFSRANANPNPDGMKKAERCVINEDNQVRMVADLGWLMERLPDHCVTAKWQQISLMDGTVVCAHCAPAKPHLTWLIPSNGKGLPKPQEEPESAGKYENAYKNRPSTFTLSMGNPSDNGHLQQVEVAVNIQSIAHRAIASLPDLPHEGRGTIEVFWKITRTAQENMIIEDFNALRLLNCKSERPHHWAFENTGFQLREDQARSLQWMIARDSARAVPFPEVAIQESVSYHAGLKIQAAAVRQHKSRGGIVADDVGFGKTITMLALIQKCMPEALVTSMQANTGLIPLKATLIIVPLTLISQWEEEIGKFLPDFKILKIPTIPVLKKCSVGDFIQADIVLINSVLLNPSRCGTYSSRLAELSALPSPNALRTDREYSLWLGEALTRLRNTVIKLLTAQSAQEISSISHQILSETEAYKSALKEESVYSGRKTGKSFEEEQRKKALQERNLREVKPGEKIEQPSKSASTSRTKRRNLAGFLGADNLSDILYPVLHMFRFHRKVVDEQSYLTTHEEASLKALKTVSTWLLTGTPRLRDVFDVRRLANQFGIYIGPVDDDPSTTRPDNVRLIAKNRTNTERFESYNITHSPEWRVMQKTLAQNFLNCFARKNHAQLSIAAGIVTVETPKPVLLSSIHMALFQELLSQLVSGRAMQANAPDRMQAYNRSEILARILRKSLTTDEALLRLSFQSPSSGFDLNRAFKGVRSLESPFDCFSAIRQMDVMRLTENFLQKLLKVVAFYPECLDKNNKYAKQFEGGKKKPALNKTEEVQSRCSWLVLRELQTRAEDPQVFAAFSAACENLNMLGLPEETFSLEQTRKRIDEITALRGYLTDSFRSVRMLTAARKIQQLQASTAVGTVGMLATDCQHSEASLHEVVLNTVCGHIICSDQCLNRLTDTDVCPVEHCQAPVIEANQITSRELTQFVALNSTDRSEKSRSIAGIVYDLEDDEQVLIFCQYSGIGRKLCLFLNRKGIRCAYVHQESQLALPRLSNFKKPSPRLSNVNRPSSKPWWRLGKDPEAPIRSSDRARALIIDPLDAIAAGHNLQNVSAVIFVAPLATETLEKFHTAYMQSIGRAARFGQKRPVKVYHPVAVQTSEVNILERGWACKLGLEGGKVVKVKGSKSSSGPRDLSSRIYSLQGDEFRGSE